MHPLRFQFVLSFLSVLIINHLTLAQAGFYPNSGSIVAKTNMQSRMNQFPLMHIVGQVPWNHQITHCLSTAHSYSYRMQNQQLFCASVCAASSMPVRAHLSNSTCGLTPQTPVKPHNQNDNANLFSFPCTLVPYITLIRMISKVQTPNTKGFLALLLVRHMNIRQSKHFRLVS